MTSIIQYTSDDFLQTHFISRPMNTVALSAVVGLNPQHNPTYEKWATYVNEALGATELPTLTALIVGTTCLPDFIKPFPLQGSTSIEAELETIASMSEAYIEAELEWLLVTAPPAADLKPNLHRSRLLRDRVVDELEIYWQQVVKPQWAKIKALLETDLLYRSRQLATRGYADMFSDLSSQLVIEHNRLQITSVTWEIELDLDGVGLILEPNIFADRFRIQVSPQQKGVAFTYPARGAALWSDSAPTSSSAPLSLLVGDTRARLLSQLQKPITTLELAQRLNLTPGGVSRQLSQLSQVGLVAKQRLGKRVYYSLNRRGKELLKLFEINK